MKQDFVQSVLLAGTLLCAAPAAAQDWAEAPKPPLGAAANQTIPETDALGAYRTPNRDVSPAQASWHVRAALNVAALGCRDAREAETIAKYNQLLSLHRSALADADTRVKALYRSRYGARWEDQHDREMTRVYNFFAQPPAHAAFCSAAQQVLADALTVQPEAFDAFAGTALPRLEAPFTDFYRAFDAYRIALAGWNGATRAGTPTVALAAATAPRTRILALP